MKYLITMLLLSFTLSNASAQLLKKIKDKANQAVNSAEDKLLNGGGKAGAGEVKKEAPKGEDTIAANAKSPKDFKVYSKFDFVPGSTILYYDNFEKDNIGETPLGWITSSSAEVVTIDGLEGKWLKMAATSSNHIVRNKKQSWGNNFTIEFDLLMVKGDYDPRLNIDLINSMGKIVSDETMLVDYKPVLSFESIIHPDEIGSRISLVKGGRTISDNMNGDLRYTNTVPVHVSLCVQAKRFRMWWNEKKLYDLAAVNEEYLPNQFGFSFGSLGGCEYYFSNIRVAKDIPDTRAKFEQGKVVSNLLFFTGTSNLRPESMGSLLDLSKVLKEVTSPVKIVGHTDSDGEEASNQKLSQERAEAVKAVLVKEYGIDG
jgi:hypothetical protein